MMLSSLLKKFNMPEYDKIKVIHIYTAEDSPIGVPMALISVDDLDPSICLKQSEKVGNQYISSALTLNNTPLVQMQIMKNKKDKNKIAPGYGIENDLPELQSIEDTLNFDYEGITTAIESCIPLLSRFSSGIYAIADIKYFPTDGNGHFFWDINNQMNEDLTMSVVYDEHNTELPQFPRFLYPSQNTDHFNPSFVKECAELLRDGSMLRGVAYYLGYYKSLLIKGHNIACAAAIARKSINCITIAPVTEYSTGNQEPTDKSFLPALIDQNETRTDAYTENQNNEITKIKIFDKWISADFFNEDQLNSLKESEEPRKLTMSMGCELCGVKWSNNFKSSANDYPNIFEVATALPYDISTVTESQMAEWLKNDDQKSYSRIKSSMSFLVRKDTLAAKNIALQIAKDFNKYSSAAFDLEIAAFKTLSSIECNEKIDDFLVGFLLCYGDDPRYKGTVLEQMMDQHWNKKSFFERDRAYDMADQIKEEETIAKMSTGIKNDILPEDIHQNSNQNNHHLKKLFNRFLSRFRSPVKEKIQEDIVDIPETHDTTTYQTHQPNSTQLQEQSHASNEIEYMPLDDDFGDDDSEKKRI